MIFIKNTDHGMLSDKELIAAYCKSKDLELLGSLYNRYMHLVYGLCLKYLKNREDSRDATMQIFEILMVELPKFDISNFKSWLFVVSKNYCLMKLRKDSSVAKKMENFCADEFMESTEILHPIEDNDNDKIQNILQECLKNLKDDQRICVEMFYYQRKCYKEISEELKLEEMKVKSYIQNGKRNLKICIEHKTALNEA